MDDYNITTTTSNTDEAELFTLAIIWVGLALVAIVLFFKFLEFFNIRLFNFDYIKAKFSNSFKINRFKRYNGIELEVLEEARSISRDRSDSLGFREHSDGSLSYGGVEFSSRPMNGDLLFKSISNFCKLLINNNYKVDTSCGYHAHFEVPKNDLDYIKKIFYFYSKYEKVFFNLVHAHRINLRYCRPIEATYPLDINKLMDSKSLLEFKKQLYEVDSSWSASFVQNEVSPSGSKRYCWLNMHSIFYRGTLEIRLHQGTINPTKIINWLRIHNTILEYLEKVSLKKLMKSNLNKDRLLSLFPKDLKEYILEREVYLSKDKDLNEYKDDINNVEVKYV